jgi:glycine cleavage system pyridoxal-binding protein P
MLPDLPLESLLDASDTFVHRHLGPREAELAAMLQVVGVDSLDRLVDETVPAAIRVAQPLRLTTPEGAPLGPPQGEYAVLNTLAAIARDNQIFRSFIGAGYYDTIVPPVIQRNILENPGWYTQYTPYQAEIAQGRLEALLNFQTMVADLTGLPLAGASLLDEGTAAAEAMAMCHSIAPGRTRFLVDRGCHPQTIAVVQTRAESLGLEVEVAALHGTRLSAHPNAASVCGVLVQYPDTDGLLHDWRAYFDDVHAAGAQAVMATDLLALTLLTPPGELGADIAVGNSQRFGVPMGFGGPHAAFLATRTEHARRMPGRIIGVSRDAQGNPALRMAIQTREQHIRREKATSNICTAQALLAIMAGMYAVWHGPEGLPTRDEVRALWAVFAVAAPNASVALDPDTLLLSYPEAFHERDRDAALPPPAPGARSLAHPLHDPAGVVHDEAQRHERDAPVTWPEFAALHPFAPAEQTRGYQRVFSELEPGSRRSPASRRSRSSPTRAPRASTRACSSSAPTTEPGATPAATSASSPPRRTAPTPRRRSWPASGGGRRLRRATATSTSPTCEAKAARHADALAA